MMTMWRRVTQARMPAVVAIVALTATAAHGQEPRRERRPWLARLRLTPTIATEHNRVRSTTGFGLHLGAEWGRDDSWVTVPLGFELAGDDRRPVACVGLRPQGRMSAWLLTSGVTIRPFPSWVVRPYLAGLVSGGLAQWSNRVLPAGVAVGTLVGGRTGGGFTARTSVGVGLEWRRDERWYVLGLQRGLVHEARWSPQRMATTVVLGTRART